MSSLRFLAAAALVAALAVPAAAFAQQAPPPGPPAAAAVPPAPGAPGRHHGHHNRLRAALRQVNLSTVQQQQIQAAFAQTRAANRNADPATRKANRQRLRAQIDGILTPAQRTQLQTALRQGRAAR